MSTNPIVTCQHCLATRDCTLHPRASVPVEAAKRWLKAKCPGRETIGTKCRFTYQCGVALSLSPRQ